MKNLVLSAVLLAISHSSSQAADPCNHPGLLHSRADLERMRAAVAARKGPIFEGFKVLEKSPYASLDYKMRGPFPEWGRAPNIRMGETVSDAIAVYQHALMWAVTGRKAHAKKAIGMINAWVATLKKVTGIDLRHPIELFDLRWLEFFL